MGIIQQRVCQSRVYKSDSDILKQRLQNVWHGIDHTVIDNALKEWYWYDNNKTCSTFHTLSSRKRILKISYGLTELQAAKCETFLRHTEFCSSRWRTLAISDGYYVICG